jgi:hypothetical protein
MCAVPQTRMNTLPERKRRLARRLARQQAEEYV